MDRFNRQLSPDERQWASDNVEQFAKRYEETTGKSLTVEQAREMLLGTGYRMVDEMASKGPGGDPLAAAYISEHGGNMFRATTGEYKDPFLYGNADLSLTPEQRALPGAIAHPELGLGIATALVGGGAITSAAPRVSAIVSAGGKYSAEVAAGYKAAQAGYSLTTGALTGAGLSAGTYTFTAAAAAAAAIAKFQGDDAGAAFNQRFSLLGLGTATTVGAANGVFGTSMFKWADIPNKITNVSTVPGAVIRVNGIVQGQAVGRAAQAAVNNQEVTK
jgi:filamentous hemagglutinin